MANVELYLAALIPMSVHEREQFALSNSGLPGPRGNLELISALARTADEQTLRGWAALSPEDAPGDQPPVVLAAAGIVGLGHLLPGRSDIAGLLLDRARDPRWRVREAVAMGLQAAGERDPRWLVALLRPWATHDDLLVQRAAVAALCEPSLLRDETVAKEVIELLDAITAGISRRTDRRSEAFRVLRKALGYGWSVAIVAAPWVGKPAFERLVGQADADVRWIIRENLRKARLVRFDPGWVASCRVRAA